MNSINIFEQSKQINEDGLEFWSARDLQKILEYSKWENFQKAIDRAIVACETAGYKTQDHFPVVRKMVSNWKLKVDSSAAPAAGLK